jgi:hypothetical protein
MFKKLHFITLTLAVFAALLFAACGGSSSDGDGPGTSPPARDDSASDAGADDELFVSDGTSILNQSADRFGTDNVSSAQGEVTFDFTMGTTDVAGSATFAYEAPDKMHMTMAFEGGDQQSVIDLGELGNIEMLVRDGMFYMNIPFLGGWFVMDPAEMGADAASIQDLMSNGSLIDYTGFIEGLGGAVEYIGEEDVNGTATAHYRVTGTLASLVDSFSDALSSTGDSGVSQQILNSQLDGPIEIDLWVGKADLLPYKMAAAAELQTPEGPFALSLEGEFSNYNEPVDIPEAPANAISFSEMFGDLGLETPQ